MDRDRDSRSRSSGFSLTNELRYLLSVIRLGDDDPLFTSEGGETGFEYSDFDFEEDSI